MCVTAVLVIEVGTGFPSVFTTFTGKDGPAAYAKEQKHRTAIAVTVRTLMAASLLGLKIS
jgi:hypothetical protein